MVKQFWVNKTVLITGHTGFKGSWLSLWLSSLGAKVFGYALEPITSPNLFQTLNLEKKIQNKIHDIRNLSALQNYVSDVNPDIIFHIAAQPLVRKSYLQPVETFETNVMGTVNLLESIRNINKLKNRAVVVVTTDKCYENKEWFWGYRENESLGGHDPYSSSKAAVELIVSSYRSSFFNGNNYADHGVGLATSRAGNVIGGGDWSQDRLIPDIINSLQKNESVVIRSPNAVRPWQHVLEPLHGYMVLAQKLYENGPGYSEAFNFGPQQQDAREVLWIVKKMCADWKTKGTWKIDSATRHVHEAHYLKLDISKANFVLDWQPQWNLLTALEKTIYWYQSYYDNKSMEEVSMEQINEYLTKVTP